MCLAVPMRVLERERFSARCEARGVERTVSLFLVQHEEIGPGDHVMVHAGRAIQKMTKVDALRAWELYDEMFAAEAEAIAAATMTDASISTKER
ncbi:MAG: HypC/HybG/HupF family hydrogenase formation chaperone [Phyllobacteriaceae bacterium]|nr:HypC/HybG/HupF family hydrogenase formation chaperone [Phyllobacteriaceae bacterium]